jgi:adenosine deaminase
MYGTIGRGAAEQEQTRRLIAALPKVELHTHLIASVPEWLFAELATRYGIELPHPEQPYRLDLSGLVAFLVLYEQVADSLRTPDDLRRATYESLVAEVDASNVRYREIHFNPTINRHLGYANAISAIAEGIEQAKRDRGVDARVVIAAYRSQDADVAEQLVADMIAHPHPAVVGFATDGEETLRPIETFERAYEMARDGGYRLTAHVGERVSLHEVLYAVESLRCDRIDHGYTLATDADAMARAAASGTHFAATWVSASEHHGGGFANPIRTMVDHGLDVSISSDAPGITKVTLDEGLAQAAFDLQLPDRYVVDQNYSQLEHAWVDDETRATIRADIDRVVSAHDRP